MTCVLIVGEGDLGLAMRDEFTCGNYSPLTVNRTNLGRKFTYGEFCNRISQTIKQYKPSILINCVGHFQFTPTDGNPLRVKEFEDIFTPNVKLAWDISRMYRYWMIEDDSWKTLVNIGSESALIPHTDSALYCSSKAALLMLTRNLARDWYKDKICVFQVDPGIIMDTKIGSEDNLGELGDTYEGHKFVTKEIVAKFVRSLVELGPYTAGHSYPIGTIIR